MNMIKEQAYGVEIEMTGLTKSTAANAVAELFGTSASYLGGAYSKWEVIDQQGKRWLLENDSSIQAQKKSGKIYTNTYDDDYKVEMVTPKLIYDELPKLQEVVRVLRKVGAVVNDSCGLHVHVDAANHNIRSLTNIIKIMYSKEDLLFKTLNVNPSRAGHWCKKVDERLIEAVKNSKHMTMEDLADIWYSGYPDRNSHYNKSRYHALNLHSVWFRGTIEFRCFNSTLHAGKVKAYVHLALAISAQAIEQKSAQVTKTASTNEKFTFRTWLLRLGLNGEEFENTRMHLLANLEGNSAWRYGTEQAAAHAQALRTAVA